jgi:hypothetical protein
MFARPDRRLVALVALFHLAPLFVAPAVAAQERAGRVERLGRATAQKIYAAVRRILEGVVARASRSDRVTAKLEIGFLDERGRMFFDIQGSARVRVPGTSWRERLSAARAEGRSYAMASNGPVSLDLAATPLKVAGEEVTFAFQVDVSIDLPEIWAELKKGAIGALGAMAASALAGRVLEALGSFRVDVAGDAVRIGVGELSGMLGGETVAFAGYHGVSPAMRRLVPRTFSGGALLRHFVLSVLFAAASTGAQLAGSSLGAALGTTLLPAGASLVAVIATTAATLWFGTWVVHQVAVKLPILWKFKKLRRLHARAKDAAGLAVAEDYADQLARRILTETQRPTGRWILFELLTQHLEKLRTQEGPAALAAFRPVTDTLKKGLQVQVLEGDWYAARMYWQLRKALDELPEGEPAPRKP